MPMPQPSVMGNALRGAPAPPPIPDLDMANAGQSIDLQGFVETLDPTEWEQLKQVLNGLSPDEQEAYLTKYATDYAQQGQQAQGQMDRADALRVGQPGMRGTEGGYQVAASPFEHLGAGAQNYVAQRNYKKGLESQNQAMQGDTAQVVQALRQKTGTYR